MTYDSNENEPDGTVDEAVTGSGMEPGDSGHHHGVAGVGIRESWIGLHLYDETYQEAIDPREADDVFMDDEYYANE